MALYDAGFKRKPTTAEPNIEQSWTLKAISYKFALILSESLSTKLDRRTAYKSAGGCLIASFKPTFSYVRAKKIKQRCELVMIRRRIVVANLLRRLTLTVSQFRSL